MFDRVQELLPQYSDCVPVGRLHVIAIVDTPSSAPHDMSLSSLSTVDLLRRARRMDGWVSVSGRTLEDHDPILSIIRDPKKSINM